MLQDIKVELEGLKARLAARQGVPSYEGNVAELKKRIAELEQRG